MQNLCIDTVAVFPRCRKQDKKQKNIPGRQKPSGYIRAHNYSSTRVSSVKPILMVFSPSANSKVPP